MSKKRKFNEINDDRVFEFKGADNTEPAQKKIKSAKRLNVLGKIENLGKRNEFTEEPQTPEIKNRWGFKESCKTPPPPIGMKVSKLISKEIMQKKDSKKRKKTENPKIAEPRQSLPRPVWTSCGTFLEEPVTPNPFDYNVNFISLKGGKTKSSGEHSGKQTKKSSEPQPAVVSFKQAALFRKGIVRDNSKKNLKLLGK